MFPCCYGNRQLTYQTTEDLREYGLCLGKESRLSELFSYMFEVHTFLFLENKLYIKNIYIEFRYFTFDPIIV